MIGILKDSLPFQPKINYKMLKYIRLTRNMSQERFGQVCGIHQNVLARIESGDIELSIHYETKILEGCRALNISEYELNAIKTLLVLKNGGDYDV